MEFDCIGKPIIRGCSNRRVLPDDMLVEILYRLPDKPLVRFKSVSKAWYFLISQICIPTIHLLHPTVRLRPVVGLFIRTLHLKNERLKYISRFKWHPVSEYFGKDCLPRISPLRKIIYGNFASLKEEGSDDGDERGKLLGWKECLGSYGLPFRPHPDHLLGCCNGLLLFVDPDSSQYYVSNPLTKQSVSIPQPPWTQERYPYAALAFDPSRSSFYKVVRFEWRITYTNVFLDIYSSAHRSWSRHSLVVDPRVRNNVWFKPATYFDGAFFRLSRSWHIVRFDLQEVRIGVTRLPLSYEQCNGLMGCMGVLMGQLCYTNDYCDMIHIWSLEKCNDADGVGRWNLRYRINIYDLTCGLVLNREHGPAESKWVGPIAFHPSCNVVYLGSPLVILSYNLENNQLEELMRIEEEDVFLPGCYYPAFTYVRFLAPFTEAGNIHAPNF